LVRGRNDPTLRITLSTGEEIEVKVGLMKPKGVKKVKTLNRDENGDLVTKKRQTDMGEVFNKFSYINVDMNGEPYEPEKIITYEVHPDGSEELLSFPPRTQSVKFKQKLPATYAGRLMQHKMYEIYSNDPDTVRKLYDELEKAIGKDIVYYVAPFIWVKGSKKQYHALFTPYVTADDKFGWTMTTCEGSLEYKHSMEIAIEIEERTELKTIESLETLLGEIAVE